MAFKELSSFIRFVTMGALGTRQAMDLLRQAGHVPIELERYCSSNKIWMTKIKRLRLPDLVCTRCGQRFEVRGKSDLEIKMSDSPTVADRKWDSGLRDEDRAIFLTIHQTAGGGLVPARTLNAFLIGDLRAVETSSKLGPPKSASEGAERDRTWPSWVPPRDGRVLQVVTPPQAGHPSIVVQWGNLGRYTYRTGTKTPHVTVGDTFVGGERIAASVVPSTATVTCPGQTWQPCLDLGVEGKELYASLKVIAAEARQCDAGRLRELQQHEDKRIALEATKALAAQGDANAATHLIAASLTADDAPWAMEAVLILTELAAGISLNPLRHIAGNAPHAEVRAAAAWGLGVVGCDVQDLVPLFSDPDLNVVNHSIISAARRLITANDTTLLIACFGQALPAAAAACEVLSRATAPDVAQLLAAAAGTDVRSSWAISCLARQSPDVIRNCQDWNGLQHEQKAALERMWFWRATSPYATAGLAADLDLLNKQLFPA